MSLEAQAKKEIDDKAIQAPHALLVIVVTSSGKRYHDSQVT